MSQFVHGPTKTFVASGALGQFLRVKDNGSGKLALAGTSDLALGTLENAAFADGDLVAVRLPTAEGTVKMVASEAITAYALVYAGASGKIAATGTVVVGRALQAAGADGDVIEVLPIANTDISAAITGTNAATFEADADLGKPRAALGSQTGGTGNFKAVIRPPTTLGADRVFTLVGDAADSLLGIGTAQTVTAVHTLGNGFKSSAFAATPDDADGVGNSIPAGVTAVDVGAVTNDANDWIALPPLADVPVGHTITIACNAGGNFEMRTLATSGEKINGQDCDGTKEYLCTDTQVIKVVKISNTVGWMAHAFSAIGAVVTAVVPD